MGGGFQRAGWEEVRSPGGGGGGGGDRVGGGLVPRRSSAGTTFSWLCHERDEQVKLFSPLVQRDELLLVLRRT